MPSSTSRHATLFQTYAERSEHPSNTPLATYLLRLMHIKRTNLCVSADVLTASELLRIAEDVGDHICILKTHADLMLDFTDKTSRLLTAIARRKKFVLFEDRKFADIGDTAELQYTSGPFAIVQWAPIINAHLLPGPDVITALAQGAQKAILQYNTSVSTDISASPAPSVAGSCADTESVATSEPYAGSEPDIEEDNEEEDDRVGANAQDEFSPLRGNDVRDARKHSVVSVSTTISMKSETMSPRPTIRPSLSRGSTGNSNDQHDTSDLPDDLDPLDLESTAQQLEELGPAPFYRALLLVAEMSSRGNLLTPAYTAACVREARANRDFVMGFIAQSSLNSEPKDNFLTMTPGVKLAAGAGTQGQQYSTPRSVVAEAGSDVVIVGRGILAAADRRAAAAEYRAQSWSAYEERVRAGRKQSR